jgi:hypothetical protein
MPKPPKQVDLHPSEWDKDWQPPIGNDLLPGEKPHIWQEFKRDQHMRRKAGEPVYGVGWPLLLMVFAIIAVQTAFALDAGPAWLIAIRNWFTF